jgi:diamine N-acetyltransferase
MTAPTAGDLRIRRGTPADAALLAEFAARTFVDTFGADNTPDDLRLHLESAYGPAQQGRELADPEAVALLAFVDDTLVAFAQVRGGEVPPCVRVAPVVEVQRFYVDRPAHGTGVAQALMAAVREAACGLGAHHLWLGVWERNARGKAFYAKAGFVDVGSKDYIVGTDVQTDRVLVAPLGDA